MGSHPQYWLVGAYWDGKRDMTDVFVAGGFWKMGFSDQDKPEYAALRDQIGKNDRIAIKARGGRGQPHILIKAIGVVTAVDPYEKKVYVNWKLSNLDRQVPSKGKFSTIHPPLKDPQDREWIHAIFTL